VLAADALEAAAVADEAALVALVAAADCDAAAAVAEASASSAASWALALSTKIVHLPASALALIGAVPLEVCASLA
jgi:hypothetical protein